VKCQHCKSDNREGVRYCEECGKKLELICPACKNQIPFDKKFCGSCGFDLSFSPMSLSDSIDIKPPDNEDSEPIGLASRIFLESERKYVTALFSDLSGYTTISERLDPEEVKEITSHIFDKISKIIGKYDGFIEKFAGDGVMALFGATKAHEDDPVRAIRAAREIHKIVASLSAHYQGSLEQPLSMHTGIYTGLVVTGDVNLRQGTHGVAGEAINMAARLSDLGSAGEILVGQETYYQAEGYFDFKEQEPAPIKGKSESLRVFRVLAPKEQPIKIHRLNGLRSKLVGRKVEMLQLENAFERLLNGKGSIFSICGAAGTGKSRLIKDFQAVLNFRDIQWLEGHSYAFAQNIPYFPMIDLLSRAFNIKEGDMPEQLKGKIETGIKDLTGKEEYIPYVGSLYSLSYAELENVSADIWKSKLQKAIQSIFSAFAQRAPTVVCLEDLHWADPSFLELLRLTLLDFRAPGLFLCVYRPVITLFSKQQIELMPNLHKEVRLQDLTPSQSQEMIQSLLNTDNIPSDLQKFIQEKVEGNPFYLEEVINSLIESGTLLQDNGNGTWRLSISIREIEIPLTINGVISARLDRLEPTMKRILQEASVIGRSFLCEILKKITNQLNQLENCLDGLEKLDLIRTISVLPDRECEFKHALTHEVVYNGLLKKERHEIHEQIGLVVEELFHERLSEFSEMLAFHFKRGKSTHKAIDYLMQSGKKNLKRYAVEESHQSFKEAYSLLIGVGIKTKAQKMLLIELLNTWAPVFYYRGSFRALEELLKEHLNMAESLDDPDNRGMFYVWLGMSLWGRERFREAYQYLSKALSLGEEIGSKRLIGYASACLPWVCVELGFLQDAFAYGEKARQMSGHFESDYYPYYQSWDSDGYALLVAGESTRIGELGRALLESGYRKSSSRAITWGQFVEGWSFMAAGDFPSAIYSNEKALQASTDPFYGQFPKLFLGMSYTSHRQYAEAKEALQDVLKFAMSSGCELLGTPAKLFLGVISIAEGHFEQGLNMLEDIHSLWLENQARWRAASLNLIIGEIFLNIVQRKTPLGFFKIIRNLFFLIKNIPVASRKAEEYFYRAIESANEIGAKGLLGQAYLRLGQLYIEKGKKHKAMDYISSALQLFETCDAKAFLEQAYQIQTVLTKKLSG
jgi:class 3 adenylate cyclase/tetratricopeptide (TPR) repeat protein